MNEVNADRVRFYSSCIQEAIEKGVGVVARWNCRSNGSPCARLAGPSWLAAPDGQSARISLGRGLNSRRLPRSPALENPAPRAVIRCFDAEPRGSPSDSILK